MASAEATTQRRSMLLLLRAQLMQHPLRGATRMAAGLKAPTSPLDNVSWSQRTGRRA